MLGESWWQNKPFVVINSRKDALDKDTVEGHKHGGNHTEDKTAPVKHCLTLGSNNEA